MLMWFLQPLSMWFSSFQSERQTCPQKNPSFPNALGIELLKESCSLYLTNPLPRSGQPQCSTSAGQDPGFFVIALTYHTCCRCWGKPKHLKKKGKWEKVRKLQKGRHWAGNLLAIKATNKPLGYDATLVRVWHFVSLHHGTTTFLV